MIFVPFARILTTHSSLHLLLLLTIPPIHSSLFSISPYSLLLPPSPPVLAAQSLANIVKTSLGPVGLDKMLVDDVGVRRDPLPPVAV